MTKPNWFVAFPVEGGFVRELEPPPAGFRLLAPEDVHLTVAFFGPVSEHDARAAFGTLGSLGSLIEGATPPGHAPTESARGVSKQPDVPRAEGARGIFEQPDARLTESARSAFDELDAPLTDGERGVSQQPDASPTEGAGGAFDVSFTEVVPLGSKRAYSALSALLGEGREEATKLITRLRAPLLEAARARPDPRPVLPHVTLARPPRSASPSERAAGLEWASSLDLSRVQRRIERVALYTWSLDRRARWFRVVEERAL